MVGGGLAALSAAISAADNGATVLLINKGITGNSGSSAKADGFGLNALSICRIFCQLVAVGK
ncbi:MAG: FAD-binding protein [Alphaproteobacteria bacterium]|nr:FAD-binding protein [Alphaproteobacteria bacterium]